MALTKVSSGLMKPDNTLELEYTSQLGTTSVVGAATGYVVRTNYYDANVTAGSGATFKFTGVTTLGKAGNVPDADGYFYDAVGRQFAVVGSPVSVLAFGAVGDGVADDTASMQAAHNTGRYIYYPEGAFVFSRITGTTGGIIGAGFRTILKTTDTTSGNVIDFVRTGSAEDTINNSVWTFKDFCLQSNSNTEAQKTTGNGIKLSASTFESFYMRMENVSIRYLPNQVYLNNVTFYRIINCNFFFYAGNAIYTDEPLSTDNGENEITGCSFYNGIGNNLASNAVYSYTGGMKFIGNKINGGGYGYTQAALTANSTSILLMLGNSIENITYQNVRFIRPSGTGVFGQVTIVGNQINAVNVGIFVDTATAGTFENLTITGNTFITSFAGTFAVDMLSGRNFVIADNIFRFFSGTLAKAIRINAACTIGIIGKNAYSPEGGTAPVTNGSTSVEYKDQINGVIKHNFAVNTNLTFSGSGTIATITSINDAGNTYGPLFLNASIIVPNALIRMKSYTVATLPTATSQGAGAVAYVTDATVTTFASVVAGTGSNKVPVYSDGTNWRIG